MFLLSLEHNFPECWAQQCACDGTFTRTVRDRFSYERQSDNYDVLVANLYELYTYIREGKTLYWLVIDIIFDNGKVWTKLDIIMHECDFKRSSILAIFGFTQSIRSARTQTHAAVCSCIKLNSFEWETLIGALQQISLENYSQLKVRRYINISWAS